MEVGSVFHERFFEREKKELRKGKGVWDWTTGNRGQS